MEKREKNDENKNPISRFLSIRIIWQIAIVMSNQM